MGQMERTISRIYSALEDHQAKHQLVVVDIEYTIAKQSISILNDPRSSHSYINPRLVGICVIC